MTIEFPHITALLAILLSAGALIWNIRSFGRRNTDEFTKGVGDDHNRLSVLETQMSLLWKLVETRIAGMLHAPTHLRMDGLLIKLKESTITAVEALILHNLLIERRDEVVAEDHTGSAIRANQDLELMFVLTLWALEARISLAGLPVPQDLSNAHDQPQEPEL